MGIMSCSWVFSHLFLGAGSSCWAMQEQWHQVESQLQHRHILIFPWIFLQKGEEMGWDPSLSAPGGNGTRLFPLAFQWNDSKSQKPSRKNLYPCLTFHGKFLMQYSSGIPYFKLLPRGRGWNNTDFVASPHQISVSISQFASSQNWPRSCPWSAAKLRHLAWG